MKVLFAVSNENISAAIIKRYQKDYKEIISYKNVYYFNAILKEIQRDKSYDRIVISEDLEPFANNDYDAMDKFLFEKLDNISDEAIGSEGGDTPIILICSDRRAKSEQLLVKLFGIGVYDAILGADRSIEQVCQLIRKPRTKKEAKIYYKIESEDVGYQVESEDSVSEVEIQNILMHYKKLGRDEESYVNSFNNIASQYTDKQLKLIIKVLPLNVKAVLEIKSPKYQSLMAFSGESAKHIVNNEQKYDKKDKLKINFIENQLNKDKEIKQVIVPSAVNTTNVKKLNKKIENPMEQIPAKKVNMQLETIEEPKELPLDEVEETSTENKFETNQIQETMFEDIIEQPKQIQIEGLEEELNEIPQASQEVVIEKRKRGRPRKVDTTPKEEMVEQPKRKRGRPRKVVEEQQETILPGFDDIDNILNGEQVQDEQNSGMLPGFDNITDTDEDSGMLPGFEDISSEEKKDSNVDEDFWNNGNINNVQAAEQQYSQSVEEMPNISPIHEQQSHYLNQQYEQTQNYDSIVQEQATDSIIENNRTVKNINIESLVTKDKKVVAFVGTSKNGTSFIVNNLAQIFSDMGIKTAILDTTQNKNSYYIYTKNEEDLRSVAYACMDKIAKGIPDGIKVTKNLTVYTALPTLKREEDTESILSNLARNYSLVLIDCDFNTPLEYFAAAQEVYLVQSMDILTIQPLTAFLRELKAKGILQQEKFKIIINKVLKVKSLDAKLITGGISYYNDPSMSIIIQLFDKDKMKPYIIPFDQDVYSRYLDGLVECKISLNGYSKTFISELKKLANAVYPLLDNKYVPRQAFSNSMSSTLEQMKGKY